VVAAAFGQRRKTLRNALSTLMGSEVITRAGVDPQARAEVLSVADFVRLGDAFVRARSAPVTDATG
jgi:16S rRNA (adenine1518-N6/adenine1519-N6)-dimethyltransferase